MRGAAAALILLAALLVGCTPEPAAPYQLVSHPSANQDARIQFLILHYTDEQADHSLRLLTEAGSRVSAHYLVPPDQGERPLPVWQLVADEQRAWHAGRSRWGQMSGLNASSLGIEIVNDGHRAEDAALPLAQRHWQPYDEAQFQALGALTRDLVARYRIVPTRVLGHSDVAPERKVDPGPLFPWQRLHQEFGVGAWPDEGRVAALLPQPWPREAAPWQAALARYGYGVPQSGQWDQMTHLVLRAFQLHFRPARPDGEPDAESWARLGALLERYPPAS